VDLFEKMVRCVLRENPKSVAESIEVDWERMPLTEKLVFDSPIPLSEEQRKILLSLHKPDGWITVVEGPSGTGKSHTITAIAADCAFNQKS
jgi:predicted ATPase